MNLSQMVLAAMKDVLLSLTPNHSLFEGVMKYDFKIGEPRQNLMQVAFSALANWPLLLILMLMAFDPTRSFWSLQNTMTKIFGEESSFRFFLLSGQMSDMGTVLVIFFLLEWFLHLEYLLVAIVFYFLSQSQLHLHLALAAVIAVYLSRAFYLWWLRLELVSRTKTIWTWVTSLQLVSAILVSVGSLMVLDYYERNQYFSGSLNENRLQFLFLVIFCFQLFQFLFLCLWGHFSFKKKVEPSHLPVYYSSAIWISRLKMRATFIEKLKNATAETLQRHMQSIAQLKEMKDQSPGISLGALEKTLNKELVYLQTAASRLTIE